MSKKEETTKQTFAKYLKQFDLKIDDLVKESGRGRDTLNQWFKKDPKIIKSLVTATLAKRFMERMSIISHQD